VGIQSVYYGGGERNVSNIVWNDGTSTSTGIRSFVTTDGNARFFDMQGRAVNSTQKGLLIMKSADGKTVKIVRK